MHQRRLWAILVAVLLVWQQGGRAALVPNDPYYAPYEWYGPLMNMPQAWGYSTGSPSVVVAVLDSGVISTTPDLAGRLLPPISVTGAAPFSDAILESSSDLQHGTWVASVAAMAVNNGIGGAGIGNFSILPVTVTTQDGLSTDATLAGGIKAAADDGARVIIISRAALDYSALQQAAHYARTKGALTFVAVGNDNSLNFLIGDVPNLIIVAGTDQNDNRWVQSPTVGSDWSPAVDLAAPATGVLVADPAFASGYGLGAGTSFAAPMAAGAAAMAWSINPQLTPDAVQNILFESTVHLGSPGQNEYFGYGRVDLGQVARNAEGTIVPEPQALWTAPVGLLMVMASVRRRGARVG